ncbi:putative NBD/HSP70 family sugar kinase [Sphingomonas zeicaulis]|uniref:ROK family transcriptional regulator n=1 Tax=Sphingomonas zeicaulis TaxID=1632740 RepID=UPI003D20A312
MSDIPASPSDARATRLAISLSGTNLERAGDYNQRVVLQAIRGRTFTTRTELAALTGLTGPTIANITRRLEEDGLIRKAGKIQLGRGQPALRIAIDPDGAFAIGLNIDRDHLSLACLDLAGSVRASVTQEILYPSPKAVRAFVKEGLAEMSASASIPRDRVIGVGLAMPDRMAERALRGRPDDFSLWTDIDPAVLLADLLPWPIHRDNDAAAAALCELHFGAGRQSASFFYLLISIGLGGGLVLDGSFYRGATGRSGELGYIVGRTGKAAGRSIETRVSLSALYERLIEAGCASDTLSALQGGDPIARSTIDDWLDEAASLLVDPMIAMSCLIDPQAVLIGGRLPATLIDALATRLSAALAPYAGEIPSVPPIARAVTPSIAPAVGAALLPFADQLLPSDAILMNVAR